MVFEVREGAEGGAPEDRKDRYVVVSVSVGVSVMRLRDCRLADKNQKNHVTGPPPPSVPK